MNNTYFIHVKKDINLLDRSSDDLINLIKQNIKEYNNITDTFNENILEDDIKILNSKNIKDINIDLIGNIVINKNNIKCGLCDKKIKNNTRAKILDCGDVFHIKCINNHLKNSLYKSCPFCNIEYISHIMENNEINNNTIGTFDDNDNEIDTKGDNNKTLTI
jgi:hypothetical protein